MFWIFDSITSHLHWEKRVRLSCMIFFFFLSFFFPCFWMVVFLSFFSPLFFFSPFFSPVFGNYFFPQFSVFKNNFFVFLRQKTCLVTYFRQKSKIIFNFHFVKETENWSWAVFIFQFSLTLENTLKHAWKIANWWAKALVRRTRLTNCFPALPFFFTQYFSA